MEVEIIDGNKVYIYMDKRYDDDDAFDAAHRGEVFVHTLISCFHRFIFSLLSTSKDKSRNRAKQCHHHKNPEVLSEMIF